MLSQKPKYKIGNNAVLVTVLHTFKSWKVSVSFVIFFSSTIFINFYVCFEKCSERATWESCERITFLRARC